MPPPSPVRRAPMRAMAFAAVLALGGLPSATAADPYPWQSNLPPPQTFDATPKPSLSDLPRSAPTVQKSVVAGQSQHEADSSDQETTSSIEASSPPPADPPPSTAPSETADAEPTGAPPSAEPAPKGAPGVPLWAVLLIAIGALLVGLMISRRH